MHAVQSTEASSLAQARAENKLLEKELAHAQKMEAVGLLAAGVAHDFNNLLTAILGYSELLRDALRHDPLLAADVDEIHKAGERASQLTRQLLAFSRKQEVAPRILDVNETVRELEKLLTRIIGSNIQLEIATDPQLPRTKVDPSQLEQVIMNLVVNARDAMPHGGMVRISTSPVTLDAEFTRHQDGTAPGPFVALTVEDSGCGMTPDLLARVFEPFFTTKPEGKGTGLGLSMVYGLARQAGGCVAIRSHVGLGTTVTVYLPLASEDAESASVPTSEETAAAAGRTVLLVDDEPGLLQLMDRILTRRGYTTITAASAAEALEKAEDFCGAIDLLITDVAMTGTGGVDLAQRLLLRRPTMQVIFMSGYANAGGGVGARHQFLAKPFAPHAFVQAVRQCLSAPPAKFSAAWGKFPTLAATA